MAFQLWDTTVEKLLDEFEAMTEKMDVAVQKRILAIVGSLDSTDGRLTPQNLTKVFNEIDRLFAAEFKAVGFKEQFIKLQGLVDVIATANVNIQSSLNNIKVTPAELIREGNLEIFKEKIISNLSSAGMVDNVILPMKQMINSSVNMGHGVGSLMTEFNNLFETGSASEFTTIKGKSLQSYARQIANDATNATNGTIQTYLKDKYKLEGVRYIGNTIRDSRPFCVHMIDKEKYPMSRDRLEAVLKQFVGNKEKVKNKAGKLVNKGGGMYPDTNTANFLTVVGGYNCRHRGFAVRLDKEAASAKASGNPIIKNGDLLTPEKLKDLTNHAKSEMEKLGIKEDIKINLMSGHNPLAGSVKLTEGVEKINEIKVSVNTKNGLNSMVSHELTHVGQINNNNLFLKDGNIVFNNEIVMSIKQYKKKFNFKKWNLDTDIAYKKLPWEVDAHKAEKVAK